MPHRSNHHPYSSVLRQRADTLADLASEIDRAFVVTLPERAEAASWSGRRADLAVSMLRRNIHQLHRAADDLRSTAHRFRQRADELDRGHRNAA